MKYLGIHKLLWLTIVIVYTLIEMIFWSIGWIIALVWNLKPSFPWSYINSAETDYENQWGGYKYCDNNPYDTVKRRYRDVFPKKCRPKNP